MTNNSALAMFMRPSFSQQLASADVQDGYGKKKHRRENKNDIHHARFLPLPSFRWPLIICFPWSRLARTHSSRPQNLTSMDRLILFSIFLRSGVNPGTSAPGEPQMFSTIGAVGQEVGVIPPGPVKYGTFAAR